MPSPRAWGSIICAGTLLQALVTSAVAAGQSPLRNTDNDSRRSRNPFTPEFGSYVAGLLDEWNVAGLSIAVVDGDDLYAEGYGFSNLPDTPATPETLWFGGSTTKAFVDATLSHLMANGSYASLADGWSTPISTIIRDDFVLQDEWATSHLTLEDAASHRTGLPSHDESWGRIKDGKRVSLRDTVRNLRNLPMTAPPRVIAQYCNLMYVTLSYVVETITGKWLGDVLRQVIWEPLGMKSTYLNLQQAKDAGEPVAQGYWWDEDSKKFKEVFDTVQESSGAGGIISSVLDYSKWIRCLMYEREPFSNLTHQDIRTPRTLFTTSPIKGKDIILYGLGWIRTLVYGEIMYNHNGGTAAFSTDVYWFPEFKYGIVVFGNTVESSAAVNSIITRTLIEDKLNIPVDRRLDLEDILKSRIQDSKDELKNALDILYPKRPEKPLPPSSNASELVGTFYDAGYGALELKEESDPENPHSSVLTVGRDEMLVDADMFLRHVSGDYWVAYMHQIGSPPWSTEFMAAEFTYGIDGKATGLEITWDRAQPGLKEVKVLFSKVD